MSNIQSKSKNSKKITKKQKKEEEINAAFERAKAEYLTVLDKYKSNKDVCDEVADALVKFSGYLPDEKISYVMSNGETVDEVLDIKKLIKFYKGVSDGLKDLRYSNRSIDSTLSLCLYVYKNVSGIGATKAKIIKAMLDSCSRRDSIMIDIIQTIFDAGLYQCGYNKSTGHTLLNFDGLCDTMKSLYNMDKTLCKDVLDYLVESGIILNPKEGIYCLSEVFDVYTKIKSFSKELVEPLNVEIDKFGLSDEQCELVDAIISSKKRFVVCNSPGGSGKTYTISKAIRSLVDQGMEVLVVAPTAAACLRLNEEMELNGVDLSKLAFNRGGAVTVDYAIFNSFKSKDKKNVDVLIFDESSMLTSMHMRILNIFNEPPHRIVMLGDLCQCLPVGIGSPFRDLCAYSTQVFLRKNFRSENVENSKKVAKARECLINVDTAIPFLCQVKRLREDQFQILKNDLLYGKYDSSLEKLGELIENSIKNETQILTYTRILSQTISEYYAGKLNNRDSCDMKNRLINIVLSYYGTKASELLPIDNVWINVPGCRVYWNSDRLDVSDSLQICRGYEGVITSKNSVDMTCFDVDQGKVVTRNMVEGEDFPFKNLMPCLIKTVHKSQGKTIDNVLYFLQLNKRIVNSQWSNTAQSELYYTAVSRAKYNSNVVNFQFDSPISTCSYPDSHRYTLLEDY